MAGRMNERRFTPEQVADALAESNGVVINAAYRLRCHPDTVYNYINAYPDVKDALHDVRQQALDKAESMLFRNIEQSDQRAIEFCPRTQGRARGYGNHVDVSVSAPPSVTITRVDHRALSRENLQAPLIGPRVGRMRRE